MFGRTGLLVSEIGYGTWGLGGDAYGPVDDDQSVSCLRAALDLGINFYDTSDLYGSGHSEEVIGRAFVGCRDRVVLATKVGLLPHTGFYMPQELSPGHVRRAVEASLRRLRTDYVDLYQLHSPEVSYLKKHPELFDVLDALRREGKVRALGLSARSPADALIILDLFDFESVQANFNLIDHRAADDCLFSRAIEKNIAFIARTPLCFGYLTGQLSGRKDFRGRDHRANWPEDQLRRWANAPGLFSRLHEQRQCTPSQLALLFSLSPKAVSTTIPGMMSLNEILENVAVSDLPPMSAQELDDIAHIYRSNTFFDKTAKSRGKQ